MGKEIITFGDMEVEEKNKFHHRKNLILLEDVDTKKIQASNMVSSSEKKKKYFIGYKYDDIKIKPLLKMLPKKVCLCKKL